MRPYLFGIIERFATCWLSRNSERTFRFITLSHASIGWSSVGAPQVAPALFTRMSTRPSLLIVSSASRLTSSSLELSAAIHSALMPRPARCAWAFSRSGALREEITTRAPCSPSASAICSPRPREPPVIRAFLPVRSNAFLMLPMVKSSRLWAKFYSAFPPDILFATKHGRATFHEGLDALLHVFAAEDAILDLGNVIDRSCLAGLDVFQCGFL